MRFVLDMKLPRKVPVYAGAVRYGFGMDAQKTVNPLKTHLYRGKIQFASLYVGTHLVNFLLSTILFLCAPKKHSFIHVPMGSPMAIDVP